MKIYVLVVILILFIQISSAQKLPADYGIRAAATAAPHSGQLRFTFPQHKEVDGEMVMECPMIPFIVTAQYNSQINIYIPSAKLNGKVLNRCWISHQELVAGGTLELVMGNKPNTKWELLN